ncbi:hypothetical protein [Kocuria palustris]|uniref:hypothetical protein n=1 Tax=Kocuria palustris TaxID=71999 RepID=UPI00246835ED|nr:hypothetical protein [Kocuria palustris]MDH5152235.1 hypothetical protein [Kocuria palustris]
MSISLGLDGLAGTLRRGEAALEHRVDDVAGAGFARRVPAHDPAVAHHQNPVHERADLVHPVGHVEDAAAALGRHLAQDVGQGLLRAQEAAHRHIQVEADACLLEHSQPMRQQAALGDALTGTDELADAHARRRLEALLHGADPQLERLPLAGGAVGAADGLALARREVDAAQHPAVPMGLGHSLDAEALCHGSLGLLAPHGPLDGPPRISGPDALPPALDHGRRSTPDRRMAPRRVDSARFVAAPYLT